MRCPATLHFACLPQLALHNQCMQTPVKSVKLTFTSLDSSVHPIIHPSIHPLFLPTLSFIPFFIPSILIVPQSIELQRNINDTVARGIEGMRYVYKIHPELNLDLRTDLHAYTDQAFQYTRDIFLHVFDINRKAGGVDLSNFVHYTKEYGFYR